MRFDLTRMCAVSILARNTPKITCSLTGPKLGQIALIGLKTVQLTDARAAIPVVHPRRRRE